VVLVVLVLVLVLVVLLLALVLLVVLVPLVPLLLLLLPPLLLPSPPPPPLLLLLPPLLPPSTPSSTQVSTLHCASAAAFARSGDTPALYIVTLRATCGHSVMSLLKPTVVTKSWKFDFMNFKLVDGMEMKGWRMEVGGCR
jgi:hypothetical protein